MESFTEACVERGLMINDRHWHETINEAATFSTGRMLQWMFAQIICDMEVADIPGLYMEHRDQLTEGIYHEAQRNHREGDPEVEYNDLLYNVTLNRLDAMVRQISSRSLASFGIEVPENANRSRVNPLLQRELYSEADRNNLRNEVERAEALMREVPQQFQLYTTITESALSDNQNRSSCHFVGAEAGTGKTFVENNALNKVRSEGHVAIAVATSGIAATLLNGGRTAHSTLKIPLNIVSTRGTSLNIERGSDEAELLQRARLLIYDEATMHNKIIFEALDRTLRDIRRNEYMFGGLTVVFSGDWRQTLPVVIKGNKSQHIHACLQSSYLWDDFTQHTLTTNMRVRNAQLNAALIQEFSNLLLTIGNGTVNVRGSDGNRTDEMKIPQLGIHQCATVGDLINKVYPDFVRKCTEPGYLPKRSILAVRNDCCEEINFKMNDSLPGDFRIYTSINRASDPKDEQTYTPEYLAQMPNTGLPPHQLKLKKGQPILLVRNMQPPRLCNGTRLRIDELYNRVLVCTILTGVG